MKAKVPRMYKSLRRAMTRAVKAAGKRTRPAKVLAAALALQRLTVPWPAPKASAIKVAASPKPGAIRGKSTKPVALAKAKAKASPVRALVPAATTFTQHRYADAEGQRGYKLLVPARTRTTRKPAENCRVCRQIRPSQIGRTIPPIRECRIPSPRASKRDAAGNSGIPIEISGVRLTEPHRAECRKCERA